MRVGIVVRRLSPRGGLEGNVLGLARHLARCGHRLEVFCQRRDPAAELDAEIVPVPAPSLFGEAVKLEVFAARAAARVRARRPDVTFTSGHAFGVDVVRLEGGLVGAYHEARRAERGPLARARIALDLPERAAAHVETRKLAEARLVLALSERARRDVLDRFRLPEVRVRVVRNGVDVARFRVPDAAARTAARARLALDGPTIAFIGSGFERKGLDRLLLALAAPEAPRPVTLLVAGADSHARAHARRAAALGVQARFLGPLADVREVLAAADVLALPARYEPFGLVVLEALASGIPAVLSAAVGASEVSPHPELVVDDPADAPALARALSAGLALAARPETAAVCRAAAERHPLEASYAAIEGLLREVAGR
jgi:UDP-glucose:(heptosyl)LPS alpha-1,3-glucosyltransferase